MSTILISAGDVSGDRHASDLVRAIRESRPELHFVGLGGKEMASAGVDLRVDGRVLAVGGIVEVLGSLGGVFRASRALERVARETTPELIVLVDSGGFHLPLARRLRRFTKAPILYYIPPQVWAWRPGRLRRLSEIADRIAVILPFEKEFYAGKGVAVDFVGHPLVDQWTRRFAEGAEEARPDRAAEKASARSRLFGSAAGPVESKPLLGLFPGSRRSEIARHLPLQIESFELLRRERPDLEAVLALAPALSVGRAEAMIDRLAGDLRSAIHVVSEGRDDVATAVDVALAKPGTITLELLLEGCPMVVMGRAHSLTAWIARRSLRVPFMAMPNLLAGEEIVPEKIQDAARPEAIARSLAPLFGGPAREKQIDSFAAVRRRLGPPGAAYRTARIVEEMLGDPSA